MFSLNVIFSMKAFDSPEVNFKNAFSFALNWLSNVWHVSEAGDINYLEPGVFALVYDSFKIYSIKVSSPKV
jgi:hypothetical protein